MKNTLLSFTVLLTVLSCAPEKLDSKLVGKWSLDKVYEYGVDATSKHNPSGNRWIEFKSDGTFNSDGDPFGPNAGKWRTDNDKSILYIDSNVDDDDSEWRVEVNGDSTVWTGIGHERKEKTRLVHRRFAGG